MLSVISPKPPIDGTSKQNMEWLSTVPIAIIDDLGLRKPDDAAEELLSLHAPLRTYQHLET